MKKIRQYVAMAAAAFMIASVVPANITYADKITDGTAEISNIADEENVNMVLTDIEKEVLLAGNSDEDPDIVEESIEDINSSGKELKDLTRTSNSVSFSWEEEGYENNDYYVIVTEKSDVFNAVYKEVSKDNKVTITGLKENTPYNVDVYYVNYETNESYLVGEGEFRTKSSTPADFLILVGESLYENSDMQNSLNTYVNDLKNVQGINPKIIRMSKIISNKDVVRCETAKEVKELITDEYNDNGAKGFVIIGSGEDIPTARAEGEYEEIHEVWPTDLYFADMDGQWNDDNNDGIFEDSQVYGQKYTPEMYFGRINPNGLATSTQEQVNYITKYLDRVHKYKTVGDNLDSSAKGKAVSFNDQCYSQKNIPIPSFSKIFKDITFLRDENETNYYNLINIFKSEYEVINLDIHSSSKSHAIYLSHNGTAVSNSYSLDQIEASLEGKAPKFNFMNMYCCSGCKFEENGMANKNLGAYYLYDGEKGLNITGSTGIFGPWLNYSFYDIFADGKSTVGEAYKNFLNNQYTLANMQSKAVLLGDPTIKYRVNKLDNSTPYISTNLAGYTNTDIGGNISRYVTVHPGEEVVIYATDYDYDEQVYFEFEKNLPGNVTIRQEGKELHLRFLDADNVRNHEFEFTLNVYNKNANGQKINNYKETFHVKVI